MWNGAEVEVISRRKSSEEESMGAKGFLNGKTDSLKIT